MSRRSSRPSSAASHSSRSSNSDGDFKLECKAAYLTVFNDIRDEITSKDDLILVLQQTGRNPTRRTLEKYWKDTTESLSFNDFVDICHHEPATTTDDLMKAFRKIDVNGDGYLSVNELVNTLSTKGEKMSRDEVKAIISDVDENKDGKLDYHEFCNMVMKTTEEAKKMALKVMERKERKKQKSRQSISSKKDEDEDVGSSRTSLQAESVNQKKRQGSRSSLISIDDLPKPSPRSNKERGRQAIRSHLPEPSNLQKWTHNASKGCLYLEDGSIMSHQYTLELSESTSVWMTIEPVRIGEGGVDKDGNPIDTILFVLRDKPRSQSQRVVTFTEMRDAHGKFGVRCDLDAGKYKLIPFSTGCRLRPSRHHSKQDAKLVDKDKHNKFILTKAFRRALKEIFEMVDLDGNGRLSREEFSLYTWRTSGEGVADEEWEVVETSCDLVNGEITKEGFIHLTEMEAQETEGEEKELWITLENMGYNKSLDLCEACPFQLDVYTEECDDAKLLVSTLEPTDAHVEDAVCETVLAKGDSKKVKGNSDLTLYSYIGDARASLVLKNNSSSHPSVELDCSNSRNCVSNQSKLKHTVSVPAHATVVGLHLIPADERSEWLVQCTERIVK